MIFQMARKLPYVWKFKDTILPTSWVKEAMTMEMRKYSDPKDNESAIRQGGTWGFPGGAAVKNPPADAGDTGSSPGPGRSHMLRSN